MEDVIIGFISFCVSFLLICRALSQFGYSITLYQFIAGMILLGFVSSYFRKR